MKSVLEHNRIYHALNFYSFTALQTSIPILSMCINQKYTALSGERVVLSCPFKPGALLQYYSVKWMKDSIDIAKAPNSKYRIDGATFALIIDPVSVNDTSSNYQCQVSVTNPNTNTKEQLQFYPQPTSDVSLSLTVVNVAASKFNPVVVLHAGCSYSNHWIKA